MLLCSVLYYSQLLKNIYKRLDSQQMTEDKLFLLAFPLPSRVAWSQECTRHAFCTGEILFSSIALTLWGIRMSDQSVIPNRRHLKMFMSQLSSSSGHQSYSLSPHFITPLFLLFLFCSSSLLLSFP